MSAKASTNVDTIEAVATWVSAPSTAAADWFTARGFRVMPMKAGLALSASPAMFEEVFGVRLGEVTLPFTFPPPEAVRRQIASVTIPTPRRYQ